MDRDDTRATSPVALAARAYFNASHGHHYPDKDAWARLSELQKARHVSHMRVALAAYSAATDWRKS